MRSLAKVSYRARYFVLVVWVAGLVAALAINAGAGDDLNATDLRIPGTAAARSTTLNDREFGSRIVMAILLKAAPSERRQVERQGPLLTDRLERIPNVAVLSPWGAGNRRIIREPAGEALLLLQMRGPVQDALKHTIPAVQRELERSVSVPVRADVSGEAPIVSAVNKASLDSLTQAELLAIPVLLVVLLLIFRSPVAALVPALSGLFVVASGQALVHLAGHWFNVDALALNMAVMIGLALGVDYSLLVVSRFREELEAGSTVATAVECAGARSGRTVLFAGSALAIGMLAALAMAPGSLLVSASMAVIIVCLLAIATALLAMPAALGCIGTNVDRWQIGRGSGSFWVRASQRIARRPLLAACLSTIPLLALTVPAIGFDSGPPSVSNLPPDNSARRSYEAFDRDRGAGWAAPFEVDFHTDGPITTPDRLRELRRFERRVSRRTDVESVFGPGSLTAQSSELRRLGSQTNSNGLARLEDGLGRLADGSKQLSGGLGQAHRGSARLAEALAQAAPRAQLLASGVARTGEGTEQLTQAIDRAGDGAKKLNDATKALSRSLAAKEASVQSQLDTPLNRAQASTQDALRHFAQASSQIDGDPALAEARRDVQDALAALGPLRSNLSASSGGLAGDTAVAREVALNTDRLADGLSRIGGGSRLLDKGVKRTSAGTAQLADGVDQLSGRKTGGGTQQLAQGLDQGAGASEKLSDGLATVHGRVAQNQRDSAEQRRTLGGQGVDLTRFPDSGYLLLAGLDSARGQNRTNVGFVLNTDNGGTTARVMVIPRAPPFAPQSAAVRTALEREASETAGRIGGEGIVGGPAVLLGDFDTATSARFPLLVLALVIVTFIVLMIAFRAPLLALIAVALNLVTVGAAVGVLVIAFQGEQPLLGGAGYLDAIALSGIFAIAFGLSIDYEVFLLSRLVEGRAVTGTTEGAISYGLQKTGTLITGAAAIMASVFAIFALSPVSNTRQFGVGLAVAVVVDATVVRLVLLPALIRLLGDRVWSVPSSFCAARSRISRKLLGESDEQLVLDVDSHPTES